MPDDRKTEDELAREKLGPQGEPGKPDVHKDVQKKPANGDDLPQTGRFDDGHVK